MDDVENPGGQIFKFPFINSDIKIRRAQHFISELQKEVDKILEENPPTATARVVGEYPDVSIEFSFNIPGFPAELGAIVGDAIHNLRAALDLAACDLVRAAGGNDRGVYFPFSNDSTQLPIQIRQKNFHRAGPDAEAILIQFSPYKGGNILLRAIHDLDIYDKHHAIILGGIAVGGPIVQMWDDDGTPIPRIMGDATTPTQVIVAFPQNLGLPQWSVFDTLHEAVKVVEEIVNAFRVLANRDIAN